MQDRVLLCRSRRAAKNAELPARQGEDSDDILKELGYTTDQIQALITTAALIEPARDLIVETDS
jgi:crotonobetainyl-CoA:carnitine CoA-transferase CaiB-like acyl-CoA transferase